MRLTFVGHASVLVETDDVAILMDPWLKGLAFNESWALYPEPVFSTSLWDTVTHLWISHEHPDHLSIPTLKSVPEQARRRITALFQRHYSPVVGDFLRGLGFRELIELPHAEFVRLSDRVSIYCRQIGHSDSCLAVRDGTHQILNINDCQTPAGTLRALARELGNIDVLCDQFSIAGWPGNPDQPDRKRAAARQVLDRLCQDVEILKPRWLLPFASFVRFCHPTNAHMNDSVNSIEDVAACVPTEQLAVMYSGDTWSIDAPFPGTDDARRRYKEAFGALTSLPLLDTEPVPFDRIMQAARQQVGDLKTHYHAVVRRWVPPVSFFVTDAKRAFEINLQDDAREVRRSEPECHVSLDSQASWYTFAHRWGLPTLGVSGRYRLHGDERAFLRLKKLGSAYAAGLHTRDEHRGLWNQRRASYLWSRRYDLGSQFMARTLGV